MFEVQRLKGRARSAYTSFMRLLGNVDCGAALLKEINSEASRLAQEFNAAMTKLRELDPACPPFTPL